MLVLGVDPGSQATGYGVIGLGAATRLVAAGVIRPPRDAALPERLCEIHAAVAALIREHRPREMAVESLFNARNPRSALVLGHARGVILLAGAQAGIPVHEYAPREVKSALTGNGGAGKEQVRFMVMRLLGLAGDPPPLDASDALAVALAHAGRPRTGPLAPVRRRSR
jgi:crossover junction endodeoxyribonuclease RuvC